MAEIAIKTKLKQLATAVDKGDTFLKANKKRANARHVESLKKNDNRGE